ncbi:MAG: hypothetical protein QOE36_2180 [Gaiellaceae bacterium]|nr:hypothetical protein [Gaiellaceae bacterium]
MDASQDAYGRLVLDFYEGRPAREIVERDDGDIAANLGPGNYFAPVRRWPAVERRALRLVRGRVLDVGGGPGRVALELQRRGREVVSIDVSPLAVEVAQRRGVKDARVLGLDDVDDRLGSFDSVVMFGNNFGLFGSAAGARRRLRRLARVTTPGARIVAASNDPTATDLPEHLAYQRRNVERGRLPGQLRLRVRHRTYTSAWFDYLIVTPEEMAALAESGGWHLERTIQAEGSLYVGILEKT